MGCPPQFSFMTKSTTTAFLISSALSLMMASTASATSGDDGAWRPYSREPNGDVHFFDPSRVDTSAKLHRVWNRIRYKTSVMGASSYQSRVEIDCAGRTQRILQNTFFADKHWTTPSMNTDMFAKPKRPIVKGSAADRLSGLVCGQ